ncbi:hypothetical protein T12_9442 [Trichinella patagoniensis]|uniref:Uncharacterized protein n=1 Tax=Trichinella patagoniensis TaxID=990121 RepID=A0A0V0WUT1_9BILA|nr:hypothetical protein T12_9442 [Trichinella patagoniensis]
MAPPAKATSKKPDAKAQAVKVAKALHFTVQRH